MNDIHTDTTTDAGLRSWVETANTDGTDFPLQNLPLGIFRRAGSAEAFRPGAAIGDRIVDLLALRDAGLLAPEAAAAIAGTEDGSLNALMRRGADARRALRRALSAGLRDDAPEAARAAWQRCLLAQSQAEMALPARIGDYTDFYTSIHHATTIGKQFRPDAPLLPNYKYVPIGYHGRASSIGVSGQSFPRPCGQTKAPTADVPALGPCRRLDYELELGVLVSQPNAAGEPIAIDAAEDHVFGLALFNDWSARDIQGWEYQPLGPFLSKNFASTLSPWVVTLEALAPFRKAFTRPAGDPAPLPYLDSAANRDAGALDIALEVWLQTARMCEAGFAGDRLSTSNYADAYWTMAQLVAHHTVNGCNLMPGDLLGTGTLSGPRPEQGGSLLELSGSGKTPITLSNGETRSFLEDGDTVVLKAYCQRDGQRRIGFGECRGTVLPARAHAA